LSLGILDGPAGGAAGAPGDSHLEQEERRCCTLARQLGKGCNVSPVQCLLCGRCPGRRAGRGGLGTNPEYAVKSTDRFLTSLSRIQVEIRDQGKVPLLKIWVRRSPLRALPPWARLAAGRLGQAWAGVVDEGLGNSEKGFGQGDRPGCRAGWEGVGAKPECAVKSIDTSLTPVSRIQCEALPDRRPAAPPLIPGRSPGLG
jgi:hypothetical protein